PREELFGADPEQLHRDIRTMLSLDQERGARLRMRADPLKRGVLAMVVMPRESCNGPVRKRVQEDLQCALRATYDAYRLALAQYHDHARFHFNFATDGDLETVDVNELERHVAALARSWRDELRELLVAR